MYDKCVSEQVVCESVNAYLLESRTSMQNGLVCQEKNRKWVPHEIEENY